jgi:lipopolysaccharide/colanic/teichoic acid biosynthesis glycosyltransferase
MSPPTPSAAAVARSAAAHVPDAAAYPISTSKRALDIAGAAVALAVLWPLIVIGAVLVRIDSTGPAIFRQPRIGRGARPFQILKLRTMFVDADQSLHQDHVALLMSGTSPNAAWAKLEPDPRLTRVGRWLRAAAIDELPQLVNVLRGEMSLVGPRPALTYEVERYEPWHFERLSVAPGITGLWQVGARGRVDFDAMVRLDCDYARRASVMLDLSILARTPAALLRGGADSSSRRP